MGKIHTALHAQDGGRRASSYHWSVVTGKRTADGRRSSYPVYRAGTGQKIFPGQNPSMGGGGELLLKYEMVFLLGPCSGFLREEDKSDTN